MVEEVGVLFWIKQLQQCRRRITLVTTTHLVHLANNDGLRGYSRTNTVDVFMVALWNRTDHYIFILFLLSSFFLFPRLISAVGDWMSTILPHKVWP